MKEESFFGPQIKHLFEDQDVSKKLNFTEKRTWKTFEKSAETF